MSCDDDDDDENEKSRSFEEKATKEKPTNIGATQKLDVKITNAVNVSLARETFGGLYVLSNLEQTLPDTVEIIFASKGEGRVRRFTATEMLRESLAEVVVGFYPFAGRLVMGSNGKMAVRCTGEGVPFVEASMSEDDIQMLGDISAIDPPMLRKLLKHNDGAQTILEKPLLTVRVTTFKCGGIILGILMNQVVVDGKNLTDFLTCWTDLAQAKPLSILPFLDRSVLCPRRPPHVDLPHHEYVLRDLWSESIVDPQSKPLVYRSFCFESLTLVQLKKVSTITIHNGSSKVLTSFEVMSVLMWILRTKALEIDPHETAKLLIAVNGRPILAGNR
ncbi:omega-hydroxypalmitate O-feruloyl transferase-like [Syzygium oleosum]|uniref:omega-hydroxypalmitate O-feruloyl transferase-like n=1 Tax=Syzygium oleosum TaxID=219896 RepID=UPI0024B92AC2|nr:omega-hydroxypalmitate O-feruloyl transferase-like [Syzygium oleosum]